MSWSVIMKTKYSREIHNFKDKNEAEEFYKKQKEENRRKKVSLINIKDIKPPDESKKRRQGSFGAPFVMSTGLLKRIVF